MGQLASTVGEGSEGGTSGQAAGNEGTGGGRRRGIADQSKAGVGNESLLGVGHGEAGESGQDQVAAGGAGGDERSSEREDLLGRQRSVEEVGSSSDTGNSADEALVAGLNGEDGGGSGEDGGHRDDGGGTEVGRHTDLLQNSGGLNHGLGGGERAVEVVLARNNGLDTHLGQSALDDANVGLLGSTNVDEVVHLGLSEAKVEELLLGNGSETLLVESGLEVLKSQSTRFFRLVVYSPSCSGGKNRNYAFRAKVAQTHNCKTSKSLIPNACSAALWRFITS